MEFLNNRSKLLDSVNLCTYCAFIFWLSAQSNLKPPINFDLLFQDKIYHAGAYFIMGLLAWRAFRHIVPATKPLPLISIVFCSLYGISDEVHQFFVIGRSTDALDWLADTIGQYC